MIATQRNLHLLPSRLYCRLQILTRSAIAKSVFRYGSQAYIYCRLGLAPYPEDELRNIFTYIIAQYSVKNNDKVLAMRLNTNIAVST